MANKFVALNADRNGINVFDGADGSILKTINYPGVDPTGGYVGTLLDMAYDGVWVAATLLADTGKLFLINVDDNTVHEYAVDNTAPSGHGFDANGVYYYGNSANTGHSKFAPPYTTELVVATSNSQVIYVGPDAARSLALIDNGSSAAFYRYDLITATAGEQIGPSADNTAFRRAVVDPTSQVAMFFYTGSYGTRLYDYETGEYLGGANPTSGSNNSGGTQYNTGTAFIPALDAEAAFPDYVCKANATKMGLSTVQGGVPAMVDLSQFIDPSYGLDGIYVEGMLTDDVILVTATSNQLYGFNPRTASIVWFNSNGQSGFNPEGQSAAATRPWSAGGTPPEPPVPAGFWTDLKLAYETI